LFTTNPTRPDQGSNPDRRGGKPATKRLKYDTALTDATFILINVLGTTRFNNSAKDGSIGLTPSSLLETYLSSDLKMEASGSSETAVSEWWDVTPSSFAETCQSRTLKTEEICFSETAVWKLCSFGIWHQVVL
jgi:hypothetical protein